MDVPALEELTGHPVRSHYKHPDEPDVLPSANAFVVAPATFNTINKWATGISDTLALGLLNEAIGLRRPIIAVPNPNEALARHPAFQSSVDLLRSCDVTILFDPADVPLPAAEDDPPIAAGFPWRQLIDATRTAGFSATA
jgi:phosphopantothenoylcysteine synthetase/decarboxylase